MMMSLNSILSDKQILERLKEHISSSPLFQEGSTLSLYQENDSIDIAYSIQNESASFQFSINGSTCYLDNFKRDPKYRNLKLGRDMYLKLEEFIQEVSCTSIRLSLLDEKYLEFWMSLGFRFTDEGDLEKVLSDYP